MTKEQIALVRKSFDRLRPLPRGAGQDFYETLFALDPSLRPLFSTDIENQGAMFVVALGLALKGLDADADVDSSLQELGRRHVLYGAKDIHFDTFREALLCMFAQRLGPDFTPETADRRPGDPARIVASGVLAARDLDWASRRSLADCVSSAWAAWQASAASRVPS